MSSNIYEYSRYGEVGALNVAIYVDYDNLFKRLKEYNLHPIEDLNFFGGLKERFKQLNHNIIRYIAFANFEYDDFNIYDQTKIRNFGVDVKHCNIDGKGSADIELVVEVMNDLYRFKQIDMFVIVSNDRDFIPLIRAIKLEGKMTYSITTKNGFNPVVNVFTDFHQFIEDMFSLDHEFKLDEFGIGLKSEELTPEIIKKAAAVTDMFYTSKVRKRLLENNERVSLRGYAMQINKYIWKRESLQKIEKYFHAAHTLKYIELYEQNGELCIRDGINIEEAVRQNDYKKAVAG